MQFQLRSTLPYISGKFTVDSLIAVAISLHLFDQLMRLAGIHANSIYKPRELQVHVVCLLNGDGWLQ